MERRKLSTEEIAAKIAGLAGWKTENDLLTKKFKFENFAAALEFVNRVGAIAERFDHHPDIYFGWGYAEINLTTHDRGGLTEFDFAVAAEIEKL